MPKNKARVSRRITGSSLAVALVASGFVAAGSLPATANQTASLIVGDFPASAANGSMNFAINLSPTATVEQFEKAKSLVTEVSGVNLNGYAEIRVFFAQTQSHSFPHDLAKKLADTQIPVDSIGPTRQAPVSDYELTGSRSTQSFNDAASKDREETTERVDVPDPLSEQLWGLKAIGALEAAQVDVIREQVLVGVIDGGVDSDHPEIKPNFDKANSVDCTVNGIPNQQNEAWKSTDSNDAHGTHVAGTIAAANNGTDIDGVAPEAKIASIRVYRGDFANPEHITCAFMWSGLHNFDITNNSYYVDPWEYWLPSEPSQAAGYESVRRAAEWSQQRGVLHIAAAGNSNSDLDNITADNASPNDIDTPLQRTFTAADRPMDIPGMLPGFVSVSAVQLPAGADPTTAQLVRSRFSNYGVNAVTVAAPGSGIISTIPGGRFAALSGTSMASPHAAGVAALLKSVNPTLTNDQITALLQKHAGQLLPRLAEPTDGKEYRGAGLVNALAAVLQDQPKPTIAALEYSTDDGATWLPAGDAVVETTATKVLVRSNVTGPVTSATLSEGATALNTQTADGAFNGAVTVQAELAVTDTETSHALTVAGFGRNNDQRADDDVTATFTLKLKAQQKAAPSNPAQPSNPDQPSTPAQPATPGDTGSVPVPVPGDGGSANKQNGDSGTAAAKPNSGKGTTQLKKAENLAQTGAGTQPVISALAIAAIGLAVLLLVGARRRSESRQ